MNWEGKQFVFEVLRENTKSKQHIPNHLRSELGGFQLHPSFLKT